RLGRVRPLSKLTVGVVGLGRIGRAVIERLRPFGPSIVGFDPYVNADVAGVELVDDLDALLARADVLTLHLPLSDETRRLIGRRELDLLPPGAAVVNVSRGGVLDQDALAEALASGRLAGAGLDVLAAEPPDPADPILAAPNTVLSPHVAWYSEASNRRMREQAVDGALEYLERGDVSVGRLAVRP